MMEFEATLRFFLGKSAEQTAGYLYNNSLRNKWLSKVIRRLIKAVDCLDTTEQHKASLMCSLESFKDNLKGSKESNWVMICQLILFSGKLLGYGPRRGARCYSPVYWRNSAQYYTFKILDEKTDSLLDYYDKKDAVSVRRSVAQELRMKGLDCFKIALVLNTTEYQVKKLLSED